MNANRTLRRGALCFALLCLSSTAVWAGCDNKDRPATPSNLKASFGTVDGSFLLIWRNEQTRTGLTTYDIYVRGPNNQNLGVDVTGGAAQHSTAGQIGSYSFRNVPFATEYNFAMRARTPDGCVSAQTSAWFHLGQRPGSAAPCPSGLVWRERFDGDTVCVSPAERDQNRRNRGLPVNGG